jgi:hypothetical protein
VTRSGEVTITYTPGNISATTFKRCTTLHVGYNRFVNGTVVHWRVTTNGVGTVATGQFPAIGGGTLGSKTYHFLDIPLGTTLPSEPHSRRKHQESSPMSCSPGPAAAGSTRPESPAAETPQRRGRGGPRRVAGIAGRTNQ